MMKNTMMIAACAGACCASVSMASDAETPTMLEPSVGPVQKIAHIYYNVASGERVVTLHGETQTSPADTGTSIGIWSAIVQNPCSDAGYTSEYFFGVDEADCYSVGCNGLTVLDYGDIALDTVVDCVHVSWVVAHPDIDMNSDGVGDGVEELTGQWMVWDVDNGRGADQCTRLPLVDFLITNLPGNVADPGFMSGYTMDVDLVAGFTGTDLSFEIGDSDGDCQSAAFCNIDVANQDRNFDSLPDSDLDGDGLFDWSWTVRFYQPGDGHDFDSDSDTGSAPDPNADTIGISFGFPEGSAIDNGDGTWNWNIDTSAADAGTGEEDRFAIYNTDGTYNGGYWFGGFACEGGLIDDGGSGYTPPAMFEFALYGPACACGCIADLNNDGTLNFFDVSLFIQGYNAGDDYNGDGVTNFFDISAFISDLTLGCDC